MSKKCGKIYRSVGEIKEAFSAVWGESSVSIHRLKNGIELSSCVLFCQTIAQPVARENRSESFCTLKTSQSLIILKKVIGGS